jgi:hypothetical protein
LVVVPYASYSSNSFHCLDVEGASIDNQAKINIWPIEGDVAGQVFIFNYEYRSDSGNPVYSVICEHSGKYWDLEYDSQDNGARLNQYDWFPYSLAQKFELIQIDAIGIYKIRVMHSGKVLDLANGSLANLTPIVQWDNVDCIEQKFIFVDPSKL